MSYIGETKKTTKGDKWCSEHDRAGRFEPYHAHHIERKKMAAKKKIIKKKTSKKKSKKKAAKKKVKPLTAKQKLFCHEYLIDLNATQAAMRAGYSKKTAKVIGCENLTKPDILEFVNKAKEERIEEVKVDANWLLKRLADEAEADVADLYTEEGSLKPVHMWPEIWRKGLVAGLDVHQEYEYEDGQKIPDGMIMKVRLSDRIKRLELIGKHVDVQAFPTKVEHTGPNGGPIEQVIMDKDEYAKIRKDMLKDDDV